MRDELLSLGVAESALTVPFNAVILTDSTNVFVCVSLDNASISKIRFRRYKGAGELSESIARDICRDTFHFQTPYIFSFPKDFLVEKLAVPADPDELLPSLTLFRQDHPNPNQCGFIMMRFDSTPAHTAIIDGVKSTLANFGLKGLRADDRAYSEDLFSNVRTCMHGCAFGIAIFERLLTDDFNPNVSLEVGYMTALGKPVLLLKDRTLRTLQTDLMGRLYALFDTQYPRTLHHVESWLREKGLTR